MRAKALGWLAFILLLIGLPAASAGTRVQKHPVRSHVVVMKGFQFDPAELTVNTGETVEWKNEDMVPHTVTAESGSFRSGSIAPGKSWTYTATKAGTFSYICTPHPNMHGKLIVR
jgi:plastocyanin